MRAIYANPTAATIAVFCISLVLACNSYAGPKQVKKAPVLNVSWRFAEPNIELFSPAFAGRGNEVLLVKKQHEPDGHEAESFTETELEAIQARAKSNPRWSDPEIVVLGKQGKTQERIDYGWAPVSCDGKIIFYSHQEQPISGKRILAETQRGNQIFSFNRVDRSRKTLAIPTSTGYLDDPLTNSSGTKVVYSICDAVNGAYGGAVGLGVCDVKDGKSVAALSPTRTHGLFDLVSPIGWNADRFVAVVKKPATGGTYLADQYNWRLLSIVPDKVPTLKTIYSWKQRIADPDVQPSVTNTGGSAVLLSDNGWRKVDVRTGKTISVKRFDEKSAPRETISTDKMLCAYADEEQPNQLNIRVIGRRKPFAKWTAPGEIRGIAWNSDSRQIAVIAGREKVKDGEGIFDKDELIVLTVRKPD